MLRVPFATGKLNVSHSCAFLQSMPKGLVFFSLFLLKGPICMLGVALHPFGIGTLPCVVAVTGHNQSICFNIT